MRAARKIEKQHTYMLAVTNDNVVKNDNVVVPSP